MELDPTNPPSYPHDEGLPSKISEMPEEIFQLIFHKLNNLDKLNSRLVSKSWNQSILSNLGRQEKKKMDNLLKIIFEGKSNLSHVLDQNSVDLYLDDKSLEKIKCEINVQAEILIPIISTIEEEKFFEIKKMFEKEGGLLLAKTSNFNKLFKTFDLLNLRLHSKDNPSEEEKESYLVWKIAQLVKKEYFGALSTDHFLEETSYSGDVADIVDRELGMHVVKKFRKKQYERAFASIYQILNDRVREGGIFMFKKNLLQEEGVKPFLEIFPMDSDKYEAVSILIDLNISKAQEFMELIEDPDLKESAKEVIERAKKFKGNCIIS